MINKHFSIPYEFVQRLEKEGGYEEFAVWLKLKILFTKHTIIYNWTYPKLSKLTGMSVTTLKKYVPKLIARGWAVEHRGHMLLKGWKHVCGSRTKNSGIVHVTKSMKYNEVLDRLRALPIERDFKAQKFIIELRSGRLKASSGKITKWYKKYRDVILSRGGNESNLILTSTRRIAEQTGLSQSGAWNLAKRLNKKKILKLKPILQVLNENCAYVPMTAVDKGYLYWKDRKLYLNRGMLIATYGQ